ncbi:MAG: serine/threonine-protein kinase [Chloroflexota bacterium]|jgi:serine/threonine-protein kinase
MTEPGWIGKAIGGRYQIKQELGAGGMSTVYRATDLNLRRTVAVKLIHTHLSRDPQFVRRFESEATVVARLKHPNIVQVYDFDNDGGTYYIVFEYVAGESLQDRLVRLAAARRVMFAEKSVEIAASIADALDYAHQREVIHRDVKPANVMLDEKGQAILTDFGIAKIVGGTQHTASGVMLGTARYVSPEQVQGRAVSGQSDIYSLGATLFEMLAGRPPYQGDSVISVLMAHVNEPLPDLNQIRPGLAPGLSALISKAMAKEPGARFRTAGEMAQALRATVSGKPMPGVVDTGAATAYLGGSQPAAPGVSRPAAANTGAATILENVAPSGPPASPPPAGGRPSGGRFSGNSLLAIVGLVAVLLVLCAGAILGYTLLSGDNGDAAATEQAAITLTVEAGPTAVAGAGSPLTPEEGASPTLPPPSPTAATPTVVATPTVAATEPPTSTPTDAPSPTATHTLAPTQPAPTATPTTAAGGLSSQITNVTLQDGVYVVNYQTAGFTESLPGLHVHFFFDTVSPENAGVPGSGPWILYGGPRPFTQYTAADRPSGASQMCILVANADHSVQAGSGNCYPLPG